MTNWLHRWWNPHCLHCIDEEKEKSICKSCEVLNRQLEIVNHEKELLLKSIIGPKYEEPKQDTNEIKPIPPRFLPWHVKQQMLESESRKSAEILKQRQEDIFKTRDTAKDNSASSGGQSFIFGSTTPPLKIPNDPKISTEELEKELRLELEEEGR